MAKKYTPGRSLPLLILLAAGLALAVGLFFFVAYLYNKDVAALTEFSNAYSTYDQALSAYETPMLAPGFKNSPAAEDLQAQADLALANLQSKASVRISSLIQYDGEYMRLMPQIADLSAQEVEALKAYQSASPPANRDQLIEQLADLADQRRSAFTMFQVLAGGR